MPHTAMDRLSRHKINTETSALNSILDQIDRLTGYIQNTPSKNNRVHIHLKCTQNIFQDKSHVKPQNKSLKIQECLKYLKYFFQTQCYETQNKKEKNEKETQNMEIIVSD